jgi:hypothetical protein
MCDLQKFQGNQDAGRRVSDAALRSTDAALMTTLLESLKSARDNLKMAETVIIAVLYYDAVSNVHSVTRVSTAP